MLPGNAYYDKNGKFLGYYEWKHWGTFFPKQNYIFNNAAEFWNLLKQDFGIEYKSISQHFIYAKIIDKMLNNSPLFKATSFIPFREPPGRWNNLSKIVNY
jgi:hypothetical protein